MQIFLQLFFICLNFYELLQPIIQIQSANVKKITELCLLNFKILILPEQFLLNI
jgi:hypothetical protein